MNETNETNNNIINVPAININNINRSYCYYIQPIFNNNNQEFNYLINIINNNIQICEQYFEPSLCITYNISGNSYQENYRGNNDQRYNYTHLCFDCTRNIYIYIYNRIISIIFFIFAFLLVLLLSYILYILSYKISK